MKHFRLLALLAGCLLLPVAHAAAQEEPAPTPTNLLEMLPEGGLDAAAMDFYLIMTGNGAAGGEQMFMHWQVASADGQLTVSMSNAGGPAGEGFSMFQSQTYGADGRLIRTHQRVRYGGDNVNETHGVVEGDELRITSQMDMDMDGDGINDVQPGNKDQEVYPYDLNSDAIPTTLLPLALGYHLREENPSFTIRMRDPGESFGTQVFTVEDIGTELIGLGDAEREVHVLVMRMSHEMEGEDFGISPDMEDQVMHVRCLPSGEIVKMQMSMEEQGMQMEANWATQDQVREQFGDAVDGPAGNAGGADDLGEEQ